MLIKYKEITPKIEKNVFIAPGSYIIGDVKNKTNRTDKEK